MGNQASRMDRHYGNYEKSFERIEKDVQRIKGQLTARGRNISSLSIWTSMLIAVAVAIAGAIIYQIQQQPTGTFTYQQHFNRTAGAMAVPLCAVLLHFALSWLLETQQRRDTRRLQRLEATKKSMIKELKEMTKYDRIKTLIDRFDPDAPQLLPIQPGPGMMLKQNGQRSQQVVVPAMLMKGSGQVAGAAAQAVAGAGKALMPLVDKLATSLISDNPMLLEDLRQAQRQMQEAQVRAVGAVQESYAVKAENLDLKQRLVALERQLQLPPSFTDEALQEAQDALHQQAQQAQQAAWQVQLQQQYLQQGVSGALGVQGSGVQGNGSGSFEGRLQGASSQNLVQSLSDDGQPAAAAAAAAAAGDSQKQQLGGNSTPTGTPETGK